MIVIKICLLGVLAVLLALQFKILRPEYAAYIGITYICEFSAGICRDAGFQTIAGQIEVFGKVCILLFGLPIVISLLQTIGNFA